MFDPAGLERAIRGARRLVVVLHDNPDPDALAAGWLLAAIAASLGVRPRLVYGGRLARAENRAMVRLLRLPARPLPERGGLRRRSGDRFALLDTQPGTGNNSFPQGARAAVVIDHHPARPALEADFVDVRGDDGCTTTLLLAYHAAFGLELGADLATAVAYAIISETQDLEREASRGDREAYLSVLPSVRLPTLGKIRHPRREREYYRTIARAMREVWLTQHHCVCHVGEVPYPEVVAELADLLVAMKRLSWCLVSGLHGDRVVVSLRTRRPDGRAHQVMRRTLGPEGRGGGHGMIAGGTLPCPEPARYRALAAALNARFLRQVARGSRERLRPLLAEAEPTAEAAASERGAKVARAPAPGTIGA
jgi:nanoRNase/pAp phosphatase (c-di-AMP/oligoRNAs hydrolase)